MNDERMTPDPSAYPPARYIRSTSKFRMARDRFKQRCRRVGARCYWCCLRGDSEMATIDYYADANMPYGFELDHLRPVETHPHLALDPSNWVPSHSRCNRQKGTKSLESIQQQGDWVKPTW
jgi:5-methylcytosine-specific restriction endonuclease McrA